MNLKSVAYFTGFFAIVTSCGVSNADHNKVLADNKAIKLEVENLKSELDERNDVADKLSAQVYISNKSYESNNDRLYDVISAAATKIESVKIIEKKAFEVRAKVKEVIANIEKDKIWLLTGGAAPDATPEELAKNYYDAGGIPLNKDNQDLGGQYYIPGGDISDAGKRLKNDIVEYRSMLIDLLNQDTKTNPKKKDGNDQLVKTISDVLATNDTIIDDVPMYWVSILAEHLPNASVTANLTLWQSYIRNIESKVIGSFSSALEGNGMVVTDAEGMASLESGYVLKGATLGGSVFLSAYNKNINPVVYIGVIDKNKFKGKDFVVYTDVTTQPPVLGSQSDVWDGTAATYQKITTISGKANFKNKLITNQTGNSEITGVIQMLGRDGVKYYPFRQTYMVAEPTATVAATAMNVFYVGVKNPISVSAPGVATEDVDISAPGLRFVKGKKSGEYVVTPTRATGSKGTEVTVKNKNSGTKLGSSKFRVKRLPDPVAKVLGQKEGLISRGKLKLASRVDAVMENFDFELRVSVSSFTMTVNSKGDLVEMRTKGNKLNGKMKNMLKTLRKGSRVYFEEIKVKMPGSGPPRKLPSIVFKVK